MSESLSSEVYPADDLYFLDLWGGWVSWMHWGGGECGGFHGYDKWIKGWHEGLTPHWLQGHIFRMLREYPWFRTNLPFNGNTLEEMQKWTPEVVTELAEWVRLGRIEICEGTYDSPYLFLYPGESQIRQLQYGKAITRDVLGLEVKHFGWHEPTFHPQLAQILKLAGYTGVLLTTSWGHYGHSPTAHEHRIWWEAPDGTCIDAIPANTASYTPPVGSRPFGLPNTDSRVRELFAKAGSRWPLLYTNNDVGMNLAMYRFAEKALDDTYVRDIAWAAPFDVREPMREAIRKRIRECTEPKEPSLLPSICPAYYEQLRDRLKIRFTTLSEYFERTAAPEVRKAFSRENFRYRHISGPFGDRLTISARLAESRLCDAESLSVMAQAAGGACRAGRFDRAWKNLFSAQHFNNYCIPVEYCWRLTESPAGRAIRLAEEAAREAETVAEEAIAVLAGRIDTQSRTGTKSAVACIVFNPLGWTRSDTVRVHVPLAQEGVLSLRCYEGNVEVPCQIVQRYEAPDGKLAEVDLAFIAREIPGFGYKVYHFVSSDRAIDHPVSRRESAGLVLQNDLLRVQFDAQGHLTSCVDKASGREFLDTSSRLGNELTGRFPKHGFVSTRSSSASAGVTEAGPVRWTLAAKGKMAGYPYETVVHLTAGSRRIDFLTTFDFDVGTRIGDLTWLSPGDASLPKNDGVGLYNEHDKLRTTFNPRLSSKGRLFSDLAFAAYPVNRQDVLGISWADYSGDESGLTLINTGNIGYYHSPENGALLSLVLAYGGPHRAKGPTYLAGVHQFRYSLLPHTGDWKAVQSYRRAAEVASPLRALVVAVHGGTLPAHCGLLETEPANVISSALLPGERPQLRIVEMEGKATIAKLRLANSIEKAQVIDLMGNLIRSCRTVGTTVEVELRGHEIATVALLGVRW